jgi:O-antigen/teichoic acid export membrane protein
LGGHPTGDSAGAAWKHSGAKAMGASRTGKVLILSSAQFLASLIALLSGVILTRILTKRDFATYRQVMLTYTFAAPFVVLGLDRALYTFAPREPERTRGLLVENLTLLSIGGLLLSAFILLGGNHLLARRFNNPDLAVLLPLLVPYTLLILPTRSVPACLMARDKIQALAYYNAVTRLVLLPCVILPALVWRGPAAPLYGQIVGVGIMAVAAVRLMFAACPGHTWQPTLKGIKDQLWFAVPLGLSSLVGALSTSLDQVIVSSRCSPDSYAVYSVGAFEIPLIGVITGSISSVLLVDYALLYYQKNYSEIISLIHRAMTRSAVLLLPLMILLLIVAPSLMEVLFGKSYRGGALFFRIYLLLLPMRTLTFGALLQSAGRSRLILVQSILDLAANAALGWHLTGVLGPAGAALANVLATYLVAVPVGLWALRATLQTPTWRLLPWSRLARILGAALLAGVPAFALHYWLPVPVVFKLVAASAVFVGVGALIFIRLGLVAPEELRLVARLAFRPR